MDTAFMGLTSSLDVEMRLGDPGEGTLSLQDNGSNSEADIGDQDPEPGNDEAVIRVHAEDAG